MNQRLELKSKTMIQMYNGYNELDENDCDNLFDLSEIEIEGMDVKELQLFNEDILNFLNYYKNDIKEIKLSRGLDTIIPLLLKESYTEDISFEDSDEYFSKETDVPVDVLYKIDYFKTKIDSGKKISEKDVFKYAKNIYKIRTLDIDEINAFAKYIPSSSKVRILAKNEEDLKKIITINSDYETIFSVDKMSKLNIEELTKLEQQYNVSKIQVGTKAEDIYDIETYEKLKSAINEIVSGINLDDTEIERFNQVYERLAHKIKYDHEDFLHIKTDGIDGKENVNAHNLVGGLLENLCVCEGTQKYYNRL